MIYQLVHRAFCRLGLHRYAWSAWEDGARVEQCAHCGKVKSIERLFEGFQGMDRWRLLEMLKAGNAELHFSHGTIDYVNIRPGKALITVPHVNEADYDRIKTAWRKREADE